MDVAPHRGRQAAGAGIDGFSGASPTVLRMGLGSALRRQREAAGISRAAASNAIRASAAKICRLELGRVGFKLRDVADLLSLYGVVDEAERDEFLELARAANVPAWWNHQRYADLLPIWFDSYLGLEQAASLIRTYQLLYVPELLQTPAYARAVIRGAQARRPEIERRVELQMRRQQLLTQPQAPTLWAVIDEAALRRLVGGRAVARAQLVHLMNLNELHNVSLQIAPMTFGQHPARGSPFTLLRFARFGIPDIAHVEHLTGALFLDGRDGDTYRQAMDRIATKLDPPDRAGLVLSHIHRSL